MLMVFQALPGAARNPGFSGLSVNNRDKELNPKGGTPCTGTICESGGRHQLCELGDVKHVWRWLPGAKTWGFSLSWESFFVGAISCQLLCHLIVLVWQEASPSFHFCHCGGGTAL